MLLECVFFICLFLGGISLVLNDAYCTQLKTKKEKQRLEYEALKQKQELDAAIEREKINSESKIQFLEGQLMVYKDIVNKFKMNE